MQTKKAVQRVCTDLGLPGGDAFTQDWAYELAEEYRSKQWLHRYLTAYQDPSYGFAERRVLAALVLDIVNDLVQVNDADAADLWDRVVRSLVPHLEEHRDQIEYWAEECESADDEFAIARLARCLLEMEQRQ